MIGALSVGKYMLDLRTCFWPAVIEHGLSGRDFAAVRVEMYSQHNPRGLQQVVSRRAAPRRAAVGRIGIHRLGGRMLQQSIHRHRIVHRSVGGLDGARSRCRRSPRWRLEPVRGQTPILDRPAGVDVAARRVLACQLDDGGHLPRYRV